MEPDNRNKTTLLCWFYLVRINLITSAGIKKIILQTYNQKLIFNERDNSFFTFIFEYYTGM